MRRPCIASPFSLCAAVLLSACGDDPANVGGETVSTTSAGTSGSSESATDGEVTTSGATSAADSESGASTNGLVDSSSDGGNASPSASDDVFYTLLGLQLDVARAEGVLANDSDPDGDPLAIAGADLMSAEGGMVDVGVDGRFTFVPAPGFWGRDTFEYTVVDTTGEIASAVATIYVGPTLLPLEEVVAGHGGFAMYGESVQDGAGRSVDGAGDVDADGLADLVVGAYWGGPNGTHSGRSYVVFGKPDTEAVMLSDVAAGIGGFAIDGPMANDQVGFSVSGAGDVDGDGLDDVVIGAAEDGMNGAFVVFGGVDDQPVQLSDLGDDGFAIVASSVDDAVGFSVDGAGDVNGDALADIIVGAPWSSIPGRSYVVFGTPQTAPISCDDIDEGIGGFAIQGEADYSGIGRSVSGVGDVDGDGLADVVVGGDGDSYGPPGRAYVVFGKAETTAVDLSAVAAGLGGFVILGQTSKTWGDWSVSGAGDVNADGLGDVVIGATNFMVGGIGYVGRSYVVFGKADSNAVDLDQVFAGVGGFAIDGEDHLDFSGSSVSGAGDLNADGLSDVVIGARGTGRTHVVYGKTDGDLVQLAQVADGTAGFAIGADFGFGGYGPSAGAAGDVDGNGVADLIVADPFRSSDAMGRGYLIFGVPTDPG